MTYTKCIVWPGRSGALYNVYSEAVTHIARFLKFGITTVWIKNVFKKWLDQLSLNSILRGMCMQCHNVMVCSPAEALQVSGCFVVVDNIALMYD